MNQRKLYVLLNHGDTAIFENCEATRLENGQLRVENKGEFVHAYAHGEWVDAGTEEIVRTSLIRASTFETDTKAEAMVMVAKQPVLRVTLDDGSEDRYPVETKPEVRDGQLWLLFGNSLIALYASGRWVRFRREHNDGCSS